MKLLCNLHRETHHFTTGDAERLIYGLQAALADAEEEVGFPTGGDPFETLYGMCPLHQLTSFHDPETYIEHIDGQVEARRSAETQGGAS